MTDLFQYLHGNRYPGRGVLLGRSADGLHDVVAYFIMGRSENSRNRVFVRDGAGIRTQAFDPAKLSDPSLVIYAPVRMADGKLVVTNGDQTDTIVDALTAGGSFETALRTRTFEPDGPHYTPRISGLVEADGYRLSILKSADGNPAGTRRYFYEYGQPIAGEGHLIHTYQGDGNPLPSFAGEPVCVALDGEIDALTSHLWESLDPDNRISLFVRYRRRADGVDETRIINRNQSETGEE